MNDFIHRAHVAYMDKLLKIRTQPEAKSEWPVAYWLSLLNRKPAPGRPSTRDPDPRGLAAFEALMALVLDVLIDDRPVSTSIEDVLAPLLDNGWYESPGKGRSESFIAAELAHAELLTWRRL